jgi:hypothetical protein
MLIVRRTFASDVCRSLGQGRGPHGSPLSGHMQHAPLIKLVIGQVLVVEITYSPSALAVSCSLQSIIIQAMAVPLFKHSLHRLYANHFADRTTPRVAKVTPWTKQYHSYLSQNRRWDGLRTAYACHEGLVSYRLRVLIGQQMRTTIELTLQQLLSVQH